MYSTSSRPVFFIIFKFDFDTSLAGEGGEVVLEIFRGTFAEISSALGGSTEAAALERYSEQLIDMVRAKLDAAAAPSAAPSAEGTVMAATTGRRTDL
jgi:hypothetical protein